MADPTPSTRIRPDIEALRQSTQDLIDSSPSEIALFRPPPFQKTDAGGRRRSGSPRQMPPVTRYFQGIREPTRWLINRLRVTPEGREFHSNHVLIGPYDDDIRAGDYFDLDGLRYYVLYVYPNREWQTKAEVVAYSGGQS